MTPTALSNVDQVYFAAEITKTQKRAVILCPADFWERAEKDVIYNGGALVFVGSQARDWYNDRMNKQNQQEVIDRARCYESEFLLLVKNRTLSGYKFNEYQQSIMRDFPKGLQTRPELMYESKPFVKGEPSVPFPSPENN
jgi:hypothetical protein